MFGSKDQTESQCAGCLEERAKNVEVNGITLMRIEKISFIVRMKTVKIMKGGSDAIMSS